MRNVDMARREHSILFSMLIGYTCASGGIIYATGGNGAAVYDRSDVYEYSL